MNFANKRAQRIVGTIPPPPSRYAAPASPIGPSGAVGSGVPARKQTPVQGHRRGARQPAPKSQSSGGAHANARGFGFSSDVGGGQPNDLQQGVGSQQRPSMQAGPDRYSEIAHLFAAHALTSQTQAQSAAVEGRVTALESQVAKLTSQLKDDHMKSRQGYDRLKRRLDILERAVMRDVRQPRSPPRSPSPLPSRGGFSGWELLLFPFPFTSASSPFDA